MIYTNEASFKIWEMRLIDITRGVGFSFGPVKCRSRTRLYDVLRKDIQFRCRQAIGMPSTWLFINIFNIY